MVVRAGVSLEEGADGHRLDVQIDCIRHVGHHACLDKLLVDDKRGWKSSEGSGEGPRVVEEAVGTRTERALAVSSGVVLKDKASAESQVPVDGNEAAETR